MSNKHSAGKGDTYRHINYETWSKNWDAIFDKKKKQSNIKSKKKLKLPLDNS